MYNGHCINPRLSNLRQQSLHSKYLHMYNSQAALYKARQKQDKWLNSISAARPYP